MKQGYISELGTISLNGELKMFMGEVRQFFAQNKGRKVIATFTVLGEKQTPQMWGYYQLVVVPAFRQAFYELGERLSDEQTEERIRRMCPVAWKREVDVETGIVNHVLRDLAELNADEFGELIDTLKQIAAEDFHVFIYDADSFRVNK